MGEQARKSARDFVPPQEGFSDERIGGGGVCGSELARKRCVIYPMSLLRPSVADSSG